MARPKVLLVELNEITWNLIDPWLEKNELPTFADLKREGTWAAPMSVDLPPQLDPWITWTTVYTGRTQEDHNVFFLQQPPDTIKAPRLWELCNQHGLRVGVYGSLCSWPPQKVKGFYVPDTFAPDPSTFPEFLSPIQQLNLTYTRSIRLPSDQDTLVFKARLGSKLIKLGLRPRTVASIVSQLANELRTPEVRWKRVALQPAVNFDFFSKLYRHHRPEFATFHTNHVAHYMHTYWKAMQPEAFPQETVPSDVQNFHGAIEHGYRTADKLLNRMLGLIDRETVLVIASSMGQKPFISTLRKGKAIAQLHSLDQLLNILGVQERARALSTMSDQFNIYPDTSTTGDFIVNTLDSVYIDTPIQPMFSIQIVENSLTVNLRHYDGTSETSRCYFPHRKNDGVYRYEELVYGTGMVKTGCHDPRGVMLLYGPGIRRGEHISDCNNLDIAPTLLTLLGLPVHHEMGGRVLAEAFSN